MGLVTGTREGLVAIDTSERGMAALLVDLTFGFLDNIAATFALEAM